MFVYLFVRCVCRGSPSYEGNEAPRFVKILMRGGGKNPGSVDKYTKFGELIIRKIIKVLLPDVTF